MRRRRSKKPETDITDPYLTELLRGITEGKRTLQFRKEQTIFSEGEKADAIYFVQTGKVRISVLSATGKEAVLNLLGPRDYFGEGCLADQPLRVETATSLEPSTVIRIEKNAMKRALHTMLELSERFGAALLVRNLRLKEDLCDQFFNHSERRLARVVVKLAQLSPHATVRDITLPRISHEALAEMVGTTRSRITHFMNKFRKGGLIDYDVELTIRPGLLTEAVLRD